MVGRDRHPFGRSISSLIEKYKILLEKELKNKGPTSAGLEQFLAHMKTFTDAWIVSLRLSFPQIRRFDLISPHFRFE